MRCKFFFSDFLSLPGFPYNWGVIDCYPNWMDEGGGLRLGKSNNPILSPSLLHQYPRPQPPGELNLEYCEGMGRTMFTWYNKTETEFLVKISSIPIGASGKLLDADAGKWKSTGVTSFPGLSRRKEPAWWRPGCFILVQLFRIRLCTLWASFACFSPSINTNFKMLP